MSNAALRSETVDDVLGLLADWQVSIPELGTIRAEQPPIAILTSNRTREIHDALKRRCLYHWVDYPDFERELAILQERVPEATEALRRNEELHAWRRKMS